MTILLAISLALSTAPSSDEVPAPGCWIDPFEIGAAPANNSFGQSLELVVSVEGGYLFPPDATQAVLWYLRCLEKWPELAQIKLDEQKDLYTLRLDRERALVDEIVAEAIAPPPEGPTWSNAVLATVIALGVGVVAGGFTVYALTTE